MYADQYNIDLFHFTNNISEYSNNVNTTTNHIISFSSNLNTKINLLKEYQIKLNFPTFFGKNWDALYDFLRNLSGVCLEPKKDIVVIFRDLPLIQNEKDCKIHLEILADSLIENVNGEFVMKVVFPESCKGRIESLLTRKSK
ncbi:hypothetical protein ABK040_013729 [Willaertia magna]